MSLYRARILLVAVLLGACGGDDDSVPPVQVPDSALPGVYGGTFPCDGCPGIPTTLWLRADHRFFLEQDYPADESREALTAHGLGRWRRSADDGLITLRGAGPVRRFLAADRDTLLMQTDSDLEHRLVRRPAAPPFTSRIRISGMLRLGGDTGSFTECHTGLGAPVTSGREFRRLSHQFRSTVPRGQAALVELEGRYAWTADGDVRALAIDAFITVKPGEAC